MTTKDVIDCHEQAFHAFGGIPYEIVYDQDALIVVSENAGDLILTEAFQAYREERKLTMYVCRKADPESKGKVENVVKFVKGNFAKNRIFGTLDRWKEQSDAWLERTGNGKVHNTTKKRPVEVFALEKQHLRPVTTKLTLSRVDSSITRTVRKDNTILYQSNRYSVPLGTYRQNKIVYIQTDDHSLVIREHQEGPVIANHSISHGKGKLIQDSQHTRDRTKGIAAYMATIAEKFEDKEKAMTFLEALHKKYPRYIRDQLQLMSKALKEIEPTIGDEALHMCMQQGIESATEFGDVVQYIKRQRQVDHAALDHTKEPVKPLNGRETSVDDTKPQTRDVSDYLALLEGASV
ncbi:Mu transposase domain-containing protein [Lentibacillus amyloliquefaciens]|uniref:Mu transposase domain-containing protein n=1 Tax=Lentibacillus amyloliquefaciens TaxID=1472767 RepID=UPI001F2DAB0B|nr:IS21 family transposase [Lentibacillus amyloliquefaciens]